MDQLFETRPEFVQKTNEALDKMKEVMEEDFESAATQEEKTDVIDKISEVKTWFSDLADQQSSMKKHEDPILNLDEVAKKVKRRPCLLPRKVPLVQLGRGRTPEGHLKASS